MLDVSRLLVSNRILFYPIGYMAQKVEALNYREKLVRKAVNEQQQPFST
jgi:hypothetical protein